MHLPRLRRDRVPLILAVLVVIPLAALVALRLGGRDDVRLTQDLTAEPGVAHVHGLGINPADGSLVVATHYGSFRIPADGKKAARIGDSFQDTMGFTVTGRNRFLGSGHPDVAGRRNGQPTRLGLIESTDAGDTWSPLSLSGEADFHGLAFAHGHVYGWDAGTRRFMVSADRLEWETRSTIDLLAFVVDPTDSGHVVGASPEQILDSSDGGRSWDRKDGPRLVTLSWDATSGLWGADGSGAVWRRAADAWERAGSLAGEPQALLATADVLYAAAHGRDGRSGVYRSGDRGATWQLRYQDPRQ